MPLDSSAVGSALAVTELTLDTRRLRFFANAIGETNPIYTDELAAKAAGHERLPAPPTFLFAIELENPDPFGWLTTLGVDLRRALHGEQQFMYHSVAHAGDTLIARPRIVDIYSKNGGALDFIVKETVVTRVNGSAVADLISVIAVRNSGTVR